MHILSIIMVFEAINASNQGTIMFLYDISAFMLHFIFYFSYELGRFLCPFP